MKLLERSDPAPTASSTETDGQVQNATPEAATTVDAPDASSARRPFTSWLFVGAGVVAVGILAVSVISGGDEATDPPEPVRAQISDPKDRPGYRSPTTDWQFTTGDPKDHATYRLPTTDWQYTTGDAKDHAGWSPTLQR